MSSSSSFTPPQPQPSPTPPDTPATAASHSLKTAKRTINIVILISGRGSNMQALVRAAQAGEIPVQITHVISNREEAAGIKTAQQYGIECSVIPDLDQIGKALKRLAPDLVCMAGFMRILPAEITKEHTILNIHPALLPMYPGLHAQRQAIKDDAKWSGCTVHFADEGVDTGHIIIQHVVPVLPEDTEDTLSERILAEEHVAYPHAVGLVARRILSKGTAAIRLDGAG